MSVKFRKLGADRWETAHATTARILGSMRALHQQLVEARLVDEGGRTVVDEQDKGSASVFGRNAGLRERLLLKMAQKHEASMLLLLESLREHEACLGEMQRICAGLGDDDDTQEWMPRLLKAYTIEYDVKVGHVGALEAQGSVEAIAMAIDGAEQSHQATVALAKPVWEQLEAEMLLRNVK